MPVKRQNITLLIEPYGIETREAHDAFQLVHLF